MTAAKKASSPAAASTPIYQLEVTLRGSEPRIWRRLQVPGSGSLGWLHAVIQVAMGWSNSHLHQFMVEEQAYSDPAFELNEFEGDPQVLDENKALLMDIASRENGTFAYQYDFGDSWDHLVKVERILGPGSAADAVPQCLAGARACPPEDCGGVWGYTDLVKIIGNPKHKEHKSMMEWLGRRLDPDAFDRDTVNACLRKLKWPHTTTSQLARILMERDGVTV
ncbi:MAG: hypothetical protein A3K19_02865 [Lentisphaerae bacterium RIFOXYB12_FULL_65_16]|nr:MAG: hypothetical protein A3K18_19915 [Lentisphaerae bacterium RIFOXYA12_64_32]OGV92293.1 MAG: hypothetical protein A3K19_02865 [Lentisphaerae bacterium RIFOXYB12_FULL_65_16]